MLATRESVGIFWMASTLGKIEYQGKDAA